LISCQLFPFFLISFITWLNCLVVGHSVGLHPLNLNSNALFCILFLSIIFTCLNSCTEVISLHTNVNKIWIQISSLWRFLVLSNLLLNVKAVLLLTCRHQGGEEE
jgi:hypothetical protein